jgi:hypothetical protein
MRPNKKELNRDNLPAGLHTSLPSDSFDPEKYLADITKLRKQLGLTDLPLPSAPHVDQNTPHFDHVLSQAPPENLSIEQNTITATPEEKDDAKDDTIPSVPSSTPVDWSSAEPKQDFDEIYDAEPLVTSSKEAEALAELRSKLGIHLPDDSLRAIHDQLHTQASSDSDAMAEQYEREQAEIADTQEDTFADKNKQEHFVQDLMSSVESMASETQEDTSAQTIVSEEKTTAVQEHSEEELQVPTELPDTEISLDFSESNNVYDEHKTEEDHEQELHAKDGKKNEAIQEIKQEVKHEPEQEPEQEVKDDLDVDFILDTVSEPEKQEVEKQEVGKQEVEKKELKAQQEKTVLKQTEPEVQQQATGEKPAAAPVTQTEDFTQPVPEKEASPSSNFTAEPVTTFASFDEELDYESERLASKYVAPAAEIPLSKEQVDKIILTAPEEITQPEEVRPVELQKQQDIHDYVDEHIVRLTKDLHRLHRGEDMLQEKLLHLKEGILRCREYLQKGYVQEAKRYYNVLSKLFNSIRADDPQRAKWFGVIKKLFDDISQQDKQQ